MEQRKKVVLKREKRSSGNKERQFRPTFPEHFRLLKLSERRRRRWHRHRPLRSFSRPAHIVKASSCASPMRDLKRRERGGHSPCNSAPTVAVVPRAKFKSLSSLSLYSLVWLAARDQKILLLTYSSFLSLARSLVPFLYPSGFAAKTEIPPSYKGRSRLDHAGFQVCFQWFAFFLCTRTMQ